MTDTHHFDDDRPARNPWFLAQEQDREALASLSERAGRAYQSPTVMPGPVGPWLADHEPFRPSYPGPPTLDRGQRAVAMRKALMDVADWWRVDPWDDRPRGDIPRGPDNVNVSAVEGAVAALARLDAVMQRFAQRWRCDDDCGPGTRQRNPFVGPTPPAFALPGDLWVSTIDGRMYARWPGDAWVEVAGRTIPVEVPPHWPPPPGHWPPPPPPQPTPRAAASRTNPVPASALPPDPHPAAAAAPAPTPPPAQPAVPPGLT